MVICLLFLRVHKKWLLVKWLEEYSGSLLSEGEVGRDLGRIICQKKLKLIFCYP